MRRLVLALALLAAGCVPVPYHCHRTPSGPEAVLGAVVGIITLASAVSDLAHANDPPPPPPRPPTRLLIGTVRWELGGPVRDVAVTVHNPAGLVILQTRTDEHGRFWVPMPLPPDWYYFTVDDQRATGELRLWLHDCYPLVEVRVRPRSGTN